MIFKQIKELWFKVYIFRALSICFGPIYLSERVYCYMRFSGNAVRCNNWFELHHCKVTMNLFERMSHWENLNVKSYCYRGNKLWTFCSLHNEEMHILWLMLQNIIYGINRFVLDKQIEGRSNAVTSPIPRTAPLVGLLFVRLSSTPVVCFWNYINKDKKI